MTAHPYTPFVQWAAFSYFRGSWHDLDIPKPTMAWIRSFVVTAARIDRFLKLGHSGDNTLPNSLVLDIIELENSHLSKALDDDCLKGLLRTWAVMANVYGRGTTPSELEMNRLDLLADWGNALVALPGSGFSGETVMVTRYVDERRRLDLSQLRKDKTDFKYVGLVLELVRLQEQLVWPLTSVAWPLSNRQGGRPPGQGKRLLPALLETNARGIPSKMIDCLACQRAAGDGLSLQPTSRMSSSETGGKTGETRCRNCRLPPTEAAWPRVLPPVRSSRARTP